jgi:two-component system, OmpR family, copper resistance phosphate regulon response regulator CusR
MQALAAQMTEPSSDGHVDVTLCCDMVASGAEMRILIIEDEPRILGFLARGLETEGFTVSTASNGADGLRSARRHVYDLVLLDLLLPGTDGLTVLRELAAQQPELPVVIVSARSDLPTKLRGFGLGATDYLSKPFAFDELLARIHVALRHSRREEQDHRLRVGALVLDVARREASIGTRLAQLSDREFRLLHHLVEHPGEVISRERLLSEVWGYHFDPGSNVVDVCVRRLRKKLGAEAPIETVRHAGYRLVAA